MGEHSTDLADTGLTDYEAGVVAEIGRGRDELVELARDLIRFDTTARGAGDEPGDEVALQSYLADRLRAAGGTVELWEPAPGDLPASRQVVDVSFEGRPRLIAHFAGHGAGPSLLYNGHIDVVSGEPRSEWTSDPNEPRVADGRIYGRGACDMKGGVASLVYAVESLRRLAVQLAGDLLVNTVTDEE